MAMSLNCRKSRITIFMMMTAVNPRAKITSREKPHPWYAAAPVADCSFCTQSKAKSLKMPQSSSSPSQKASAM